jgi:hypothetical protein
MTEDIKKVKDMVDKSRDELLQAVVDTVVDTANVIQINTITLNNILTLIEKQNDRITFLEDWARENEARSKLALSKLNELKEDK